MRSEKVQHRAKRAGFDYNNVQEALTDLQSEVEELKQALDKEDISNIDEEIGDVLFSCVNISRFFKIDAEKSLTNSTEKFINRFRDIERNAIAQDIDIGSAGMDTLNALWNCAKKSGN